MSTPPASPAASLLLVAHGSPDQRSAQAMTRLADDVRAHLTSTVVELGFLETSLPPLATAVAQLPQHRPVVVVPLLLAAGYHTDVDLPEQLAALGVELDGRNAVLTSALGPDPLLDAALQRRLREAGVPSAPAAQSQIVDGWRVVKGSARYQRDELLAAVASARDAGAERVAVAAYLLAPGYFHDLLGSLGAELVTEPLVGTPELTTLICHRMTQGVTALAQSGDRLTGEESTVEVS